MSTIVVSLISCQWDTVLQCIFTRHKITATSNCHAVLQNSFVLLQLWNVLASATSRIGCCLETKHGADLSSQIKGTWNYAGLMPFVIRKHVDILCSLRETLGWCVCVLWERHRTKVLKDPGFFVFLASNLNFAVQKVRTYVPWIDHCRISLELLRLYGNSVHTNIDTDRHVITCGSDMLWGLIDIRHYELDDTSRKGEDVSAVIPTIRGTLSVASV